MRCCLKFSVPLFKEGTQILRKALTAFPGTRHRWRPAGVRFRGYRSCARHCAGQHRARADGQLIHTDRQEGFGQGQVRAKVRRRYQPKCRSVGILPPPSSGSAALPGCVAGQKSSADHLFWRSQARVYWVRLVPQLKKSTLGQTVTHDGRCRGFDHDADLHILRKGNALSFQVALDFLAVLFGSALPHAGHHGEHDAQLAERGSTVKGTQAGSEDRGGGSDRYAERMPIAGLSSLGRLAADLLVRADIQRANDNFLAAHIGKNLFVGFKLLVLGGVIRLFRYRNSLRNRPMPPPSLTCTACTSSVWSQCCSKCDALAILGHIGLASGLQQALQAQLLFSRFSAGNHGSYRPGRSTHCR